MFENDKDARELETLLESWVQDAHGTKKAFTCIRDMLEGLDGVVMRFYPRPGISYSLRAVLSAGEDEAGRLFALVDIVEDPSERWLSVCFYERMVTDPMESGEMVPKGLLGEDGYCFHVTCYDEELMTYLKERILEAYSFSRDKQTN